MRTGFREILWNFSNSVKNAGFRNFRGIAEKLTALQTDNRN